MQNQKGIATLIGLLMVIVITVVLFGIVLGYQGYSESQINSAKDAADAARNASQVAQNAIDAANNVQNLVGGDKDSHGCIGSAGYTWCELKQKCLRTWEEKCEDSSVNIKKLEDCIAYDQLGSIEGCYNKYCTKISPDINKDFLVNKKIISFAASGIEWRFISGTNLLILRGHSVDDPEIPAQTGTWLINNGVIITQDPWIKDPNSQFSFKNLQFYNCGDGKTEGIAKSSIWADYGSGNKEYLIEYRIVDIIR